MGIWNFQSILNRGELDPLMFGRVDLIQYYNGLQTALNVLCLPQGGVKKRPGQEYISNALGNGRLENFSFNVEQNYLLVFTNLRMQIFKNGILQTNINGSGFDYLVTPYTLAQVRVFDYIQSADTIIITHPDVEPVRITRSSDTAWTLNNLILTNIPKYDFNDTLSPAETEQIQTLTFTTGTVNNGDRFKIGLNGILTEEIIYSETTAGRITMANSIRDELLALPNTANSGVGVNANSATPPLLVVVFSGDSANDYDEMTGTPVSTELITFEITGSITQEGASREEYTWSSTRGWPSVCTFHEGRLWFGNTKYRPQTIWGSVVSDFFNFKTRIGLDDEAVEATLDTDQVNAIQSLFSNRSLQVFTSGGEFYIPTSPITPSNIAVQPQTNFGSKRIRPVTIDGITLFIQRTGKALLQFLFIDEFKSNQTSSVSVLSPSLIKDPIEFSASTGTEISDANYVYIVNSDGTMTVFNTLGAQDVAGFTRWETGGNIKSVAVVDNKVNLLIERVINGSTVYFIEQENTYLNTDASKLTVGTDISVVTGLDYLEGETVKVKVDGAVRLNDVVTSGQINIDPVGSVIEIGKEFLPIIKTMPLNVNLQNGPNVAQKKRITRVSLQLLESNGIIVQGQRLADKTIGLNQFDAPTPQTGIKRIFINGWSLEAEITITQDTPFPMAILNIGLEVSV